jgi:hypothetical protein
MTLILMTTGVLAYLAARVGWSAAGVAHRRAVAAAGRREDRESLEP